MSDAEHHADDSGALFDRVLVEYLQRIDAGEEIDREQFIAAHPEVADELRDYFRTADDVEQLRQREPAATLDSDSASDTATPPLATIRYFGDYELLEEIARGGMGVVYKARQASLNRTVALKMILAGQLASEEDVQRFHAEAEAAANLDHPGIVPIYEVGIHNGQHYFSMGYVEGNSLAARIVDGPLPPREAAEATQRVAEAVAYAHAHGVIHRDLKPANVLLDKHGHPRVTDFGLAKRVQADSDMTRSGQILGTPSSMPPEQASGKITAIKETADVYALGAILYALLTGRPPFQADNQLDTLMQVLEREPVGPQALNPKIPKDLETICLKCLEKEPSKRYESATEVTQELQCFLEGRPIKARPIGPVRRAVRWCRRKPVVATLLALLAASMVIGTSVSLFWARRAEIKANEATANATRAGKAEKRANREAATAKANEATAKANEMMARRHFYAGQMNLAQRAFEDGRLERAKTFLSSQTPENTGGVDLRGFEWYLMWQKAHPELRTFEGWSFATFNQDGRFVATRGMRERGFHVVVWDTRDGELCRSYSTVPGMPPDLSLIHI
jgi:tRNA A-37 threonylcarbamoyl transferase component Bud32